MIMWVLGHKSCLLLRRTRTWKLICVKLVLSDALVISTGRTVPLAMKFIWDVPGVSFSAEEQLASTRAYWCASFLLTSQICKEAGMDQHWVALTTAETASTVHSWCYCSLSGSPSLVKMLLLLKMVKVMRGRQLTLAFVLEGKKNYQLTSWAEVVVWEAAELGLYLNIWYIGSRQASWGFQK